MSLTETHSPVPAQVNATMNLSGAMYVLFGFAIQ